MHPGFPERCFLLLLNPQYKWLFLLYRQKLQLDSSGSFHDVFSVDFVPEFNLSVLQKNSLKEEQKENSERNLILFPLEIICDDGLLPAVLFR